MQIRSINLLFFCAIISLSLSAQNPETDKGIQEKMNLLSFLKGNWKGKGWIMRSDGKHTFDQTEKVQFKLDHTVMLIEGNGMAEGKNIHNALAVISWNKESNNYNFQSWLATGQSGKFKAEIKDNKLYWYPSDNMQYVIWLNEKGQWAETGEMKRNNEWFRFFEMTLDKEREK
jgi:hypothetical protein